MQKVIEKHLQEFLHTLETDLGAEQARKLKTILLVNLNRGRIQAFIQDDLANLPEYVHKVVATHDRFAAQVKDLQQRKTEPAWHALIEKMRLWAYNFLVKNNFSPDAHTFQIACDYATEAAMAVQQSHYPYDVDFDAWARVILMNTCRKQMRTARKKSRVPDENLAALDEVIHQLSLDPGQKNDQRIDLMDAIAQLIPARQEVILLRYFEGKSAAEIAAQTGKTTEAIYNLHFQAIRDLREILGRTGNNDE